MSYLFTFSEAKTFATFWFLHYIFPPQQKTKIDDTGTKNKKKYSIPDSQDSFAVMAETCDEMDVKIKLLKLQRKCIQPKLLIVGDLSNIKKISVYFDDLVYQFLSILDAIDLLFKIFYVFNLQYPEESEIFYNFIQNIFYEIPTNKEFMKVSTVKNEILNIKI